MAAGALLWSGCSDGDGGAREERGRSTGPSSSAPPAPGGASPRPTAPDFTPDPARTPRTAAAARALADAVVADPGTWGPGFVRRTPYRSDPGYWPVLGEDCVWARGTRPRGVLASVTTYSELPAEPGKGPLRVAATVTVHRDVAGADWEMAETLEEALRCPDQTLREGERVTGLLSVGSPFGRSRNYSSEDALGESGDYHSDEFGKGAYTYDWSQSRVGQVTVAVVSKGAKGRTQDEVSAARSQAQVAMATRAERRLEAGT
ncbi:hypothetical protein RB200_31575 [Streptomyces sp. PmtG]